MSGSPWLGHAGGRKRKRGDYKRWERARAMELWQMDIGGGVHLADGSGPRKLANAEPRSRVESTRSKLSLHACGPPAAPARFADGRSTM